MSRIGRLPIKIETGVTVEFANSIVTVKGPLGTLTQAIQNSNIDVIISEDNVMVVRSSEDKATKACHGLYRAIIFNLIVGVTKGYAKVMVINGVGYKAVKQGDKVILTVGYSHTVEVVPPKGITLTVIAPTELEVRGIDKVLVGQVAADIKAIRKPEPYHGYGIRYKNETIIRKEGKTAGK